MGVGRKPRAPVKPPSRQQPKGPIKFGREGGLGVVAVALKVAVNTAIYFKVRNLDF